MKTEILLVGAGQTGSLVIDAYEKQFLGNLDVELVGIVDPAKKSDFYGGNYNIYSSVDEFSAHYNKKDNDTHLVAIIFCREDSLFDVAGQCVSFQIPMLIGTTGWYDLTDDFASSADGIPYKVFGNFNHKTNAMKLLCGDAITCLGYDNYEYVIQESHHIRKSDYPSGTAVEWAKEVISKSNRYKYLLSIKYHNTIQDAKIQVLSTGEEHSINLDEVPISFSDELQILYNGKQLSYDVLPIISIREGDIVGRHELRALQYVGSEVKGFSAVFDDNRDRILFGIGAINEAIKFSEEL